MWDAGREGRSRKEADGRMENRLRSVSLTQSDRIKEKEKACAEPFKTGGLFLSPPTKKMTQESEKVRMEEKDKALEERELKRRREPETLEEKLDSFLAIIVERMDRVEQRMDDWKKTYEDLHGEIEAERRYREEDKREGI